MREAREADREEEETDYCFLGDGGQEGRRRGGNDRNWRRGRKGMSKEERKLDGRKEGA